MKLHGKKGGDYFPNLCSYYVLMPSEIEDEKGLLFDIRFALRKAPVCRSRDERQSDQWRDLVARYVLDHLRLTNWIIKRGEPAKHTGPSAPPMKEPDGQKS